MAAQNLDQKVTMHNLILCTIYSIYKMYEKKFELIQADAKKLAFSS